MSQHRQLRDGHKPQRRTACRCTDRRLALPTASIIATPGPTHHLPRNVVRKHPPSRHCSLQRKLPLAHTVAQPPKQLVSCRFARCCYCRRRCWCRGGRKGARLTNFGVGIVVAAAAVADVMLRLRFWRLLRQLLLLLVRVAGRLTPE